MLGVLMLFNKTVYSGERAGMTKNAKKLKILFKTKKGLRICNWQVFCRKLVSSVETVVKIGLWEKSESNLVDLKKGSILFLKICALPSKNTGSALENKPYET